MQLFAQPIAQTAPAATAGLDIIYADDALLVLNKPSGLLAVPGRGEDKQDCLSARVQQQFPDALVVHRLDMATSGLMLMARGTAAQGALSRAFAVREVHKRYMAVVDGHLAPPAGTLDGWGVIDLPIVVDWPKRPLRIIDKERGKPSLTRWRVFPNDPRWGAPTSDEDAATTRLELEPVTGRSHQLRVHLQALGHPILGDALYASPAAQARAKRLLLHAWALRIRHPQTGHVLAFDSPPPF